MRLYMVDYGENYENFKTFESEEEANEFVEFVLNSGQDAFIEEVSTDALYLFYA